MQYLLKTKIIVLIAVFQCDFGKTFSTRTLCDVRLWYLNLITDNVFSTDLNADQQNLKNSIESLANKASKSLETRKIDCHILEMYNDMLSETFGYTSQTKLHVSNTKETVDVDPKNNSKGKGKEQIQQKLNQTNSQTIQGLATEEKANIETVPVTTDIDHINENKVEENIEEGINKDASRRTTNDVDKDMSSVEFKNTDALDERDGDEMIVSDVVKNDNELSNTADSHVKEDDINSETDSFHSVKSDSTKSQSGKTIADASPDDSVIISSSDSGTQEIDNEVDLNVGSHFPHAESYDFNTDLDNTGYITEEKDVTFTASQNELLELKKIDTDEIYKTKLDDNNNRQSNIIKIASQKEKTLENMEEQLDLHVEIDDNKDMVRDRASGLKSKSSYRNAKPSTKNIPYGVCPRFGCVKIEVFNVFAINVGKPFRQKNKDHVTEKLNKKDKTFICPTGNYCNINCYFSYSFRHSLSIDKFTYGSEIPSDDEYMADDGKTGVLIDANFKSESPDELKRHQNRVIDGAETNLKGKFYNKSKKNHIFKNCPPRNSCNRKCHLIYLHRLCSSVDIFTNKPRATPEVKTKNAEKCISSDFEINKNVKDLKRDGMTRVDTEESYAKLQLCKKNELFRKCSLRKSCNRKCYLTYSVRYCLSVDKSIHILGTISGANDNTQSVKGQNRDHYTKTENESYKNQQLIEDETNNSLNEHLAEDDMSKHCYDHYTSGNLRDGAYKVKPVASGSSIQVFCDMRQGGWTVLQKRQDGTTNFFQDWENYKKGFGGVYGEHWLGSENIHLLTNQDYYQLKVELGDWNKNKRYAYYDYILVDREEEGYRLHIDGYNGDAGDGLLKHNGSKFSTKDVDNDKVVKEFGGSCAKRFHGAGWYFKCYVSNLNGKYYKAGKIPEKRFDGITWKPWTGPNYSLKSVQMKIRPASVNH